MRRLFKLLAFVFGLVGGWLLVNRMWEKWQPQQVVAPPVPTVEPERVEPLGAPPAPAEPVAHASADDGGDTSTAPAPAPEAPEAPAAAQTEHADNATSAPVAYCVRCRQKQPVRDPVYETTPKGRRRLRGTCAVCGAKVSQFVKST